MRGCMKLKIIINKMTDFINNLINIISSKYTRVNVEYKYNYFYYYTKNIELLESKTIDAIYDIIERSAIEIDSKMIKETGYFLSNDASNEIVKCNNKDITNYILFCLYVSLIDVKVRRMYFNRHTSISVKEKVRPDKYLCEVLNYRNEFQFYAYAKTILKLPLVENFVNKMNMLKQLKPPMPYFDILDNVVIYEKPTKLDPLKDPLVEVLKDIVNQLKTINKYFMFEYIDKTSIGRSQKDLKRYFVFFFDSLINVDDKVTSYNVYDGRQHYETITAKDQIRTVIHVLSEIYVTGRDTYIKKCQVEPFVEYLTILDSLDELDIHKNFILYLMNIKNEDFG